VRTLETWIFGAILTLVGFLIIACSLGKSELGIFYVMTGATSTLTGSLIFVINFKKWIDNL